MADEIKIDELNSEIAKLNSETEEIDDQLRKNQIDSEETYRQRRFSQELLSNLRDSWRKDESMLRWLDNVNDDMDTQFKKAQAYFDENEDELRNSKRLKENTIEDALYEKRVL